MPTWDLPNDLEFKAKLSVVISTRRRQPQNVATERLAGVLLMLYPKEGSTHILFTRRSETVAEHKGEISFPGGAKDSGDDSLLRTALREAGEELGIKIDESHVLGALDDVYVPPTRFLISPFVAFLGGPPRPNPNIAEIGEVLEVPVAELMNPAIFREETKELGGTVRRILSYRYGEHVIWGATAKILKQFLDLVSLVGHEPPGIQAERGGTREENVRL